MDNNSMDRYLGQLLDNRYEILEVIGRGGMAVVYKARCHLLNRYVAVKILRDDMAADSVFRENFKKEAQAVAMLSHPNIVSIYDVSRTPLVDYIVMELIEGITLKQYMKSKGALSCKETVHFITQIAKALSHAHGKGIVHRDIKPQNIMITLDGAVKVADFGIAYLESAQAAEQAAVGSVHYVSPEQAKGQSVDARSDIYSLGVVMYEMLTGKLPYVGDNAEAIALCHVSSTPVPPREVMMLLSIPLLWNTTCQISTTEATGTIMGLKKKVRNQLFSGMRHSSIRARARLSATASGTAMIEKRAVFLAAVWKA